MTLDPGGIPQTDGHHHADELVRLAIRRPQRVELRHPRVLRGMQLREDFVEWLFEDREIPVLLIVVHGANLVIGATPAPTGERSQS